MRGRYPADQAGQHPARPGRPGRQRGRDSRQVRGPEPDRVVQGPRHDHGGQQGGREGSARAIVCASTGNTSASAAAYAARAGMKAFVLIPEGKISMGKLGPGDRPRGDRAADQGQLRRRDAAGQGDRRRQHAGGAGQLGQSRTGCRARRPVRSRSSRRWAGHRTTTAFRSATPATSPATGSATARRPGTTPPAARCATGAAPTCMRR